MKRIVISGLVGLVVGAALTGLVVVKAMPGMMIVTRPSRLGFEETVQAIQKGIKEQGWSSPATLDLNKSLARHGVTLDPQVRIIQLCQPEYAKDVLTTDRYVASLMPCAIAVYESDDGRVCVSKMNTGLMGTLFGGNVAEVMGGKVAKDERAILDAVVADE
ncbi:MAG: DUF302 domain-containing protein [Phycisphaerae bacterium]